MIRYKLVFVNKEISPGDFARQSGIHISKIRAALELLDITNEMLSIIEAEILAEHCKTIKIINTESDAAKLISLKKIIGKEKRIPVISIMGHIDHGKTTIIDKIMKTHFVDHEPGGITQNISLYKITHKHQDFFLIDTPGHGIFSDIRQFIINNTDILVLIVAADDGIKEQTEEIIKQSKGVEKIVCINKIDKTNKDLDKSIEKIFCRLAELDIVLNEYGGDVLMCKCSGKTGMGIDNLIDTIFLKSEFMEFRADSKQEGIGYVLDSYQQKGIGLVTRILLKTGTMKTGDKFLCKNIEGNIKRILVDKKQAPSANFNDLIDIIGFHEAPEPGSKFLIINEDDLKKDLAIYFEKNKIKSENGVFEVNFLIKADNINHLTTLEKSLEIKGKIIHKSIGEITENEIEMAKTFNAILVCWGKTQNKIVDILKSNQIKFIFEEIVYDLIDSVDILLSKPKDIEYKTVAKASILKIFNIKNIKIAGCKVIEGTIKKGNLCRIIRNNEIISEAKISSMKREKDTITEAIDKSECGIVFNKNIDFLVGDLIEAIEESE